MSPPLRTASSPPLHVVIAGGGVAALEALFALRDLADHRVRITLLSPSEKFVEGPVTVGEAFDRTLARSHSLPEIVEDRLGDRFQPGRLMEVDPDSQLAVAGDGTEIAYDELVIATGAQAREAVPGALTFRGRRDVPILRELLDDLVHGRSRSVAYTIASDTGWPLPAYELALMTAGHLRENAGQQADSSRAAFDLPTVWLVTPEEELLALFGPAASDAIGPLLASRGVRVRTASRPARVHAGALELVGGGRIHVDRVVALAVPEGPRVPGLPSDRHGFLPIDSHGRVTGCAHVYAAGDVTAFPLKQGGLATQQADAVAECIAAEAGVSIRPQPFRPVLRGLLMTGGAPLYLRAEPHRLGRESTVAIEARPVHHNVPQASAAASQPLWWPPAKIAGRYLSPFLATARPIPLSAGVLHDRVPVPGRPLDDAEYEDAVELALLLADSDARWGDFPSALEALDAAESLQGSLPPEYEVKRRAWLGGHALD